MQTKVKAIDGVWRRHDAQQPPALPCNPPTPHHLHCAPPVPLHRQCEWRPSWLGSTCLTTACSTFTPGVFGWPATASCLPARLTLGKRWSTTRCWWWGGTWSEEWRHTGSSRTPGLGEWLPQAGGPWLGHLTPRPCTVAHLCCCLEPLTCCCTQCMAQLCRPVPCHHPVAPWTDCSSVPLLFMPLQHGLGRGWLCPDRDAA